MDPKSDANDNKKLNSTAQNSIKQNPETLTETSNSSQTNKPKKSTKITASSIREIPPFRHSSKNSNTKDKITTVIATPGASTENTPVKLQYTNQRVIGNGSFGVVHKADLCGNSLQHLDKDGNGVSVAQKSENNNESSTTNEKINSADNTGTTNNDNPKSNSNNLANGSSEQTTSSSEGKRYQVAIKKVLQDKRFKNRELAIMRTLSHINIVQLKFFFYWWVFFNWLFCIGFLYEYF